MQNLELESEVIQISMYMDIILNILKKHKELSIIKIMLFSYLIKKEVFRIGKVYSAGNTQDIVYKAISLLSGEYEEYCENLKFVLKSIHLLKTNNQVMMNGCLLYLANDIELNSKIYSESPFIEKAIEASKRMTDRQFMREVMANV